MRRFINAWKKFRMFLKEEAEVSRAERRLARVPLDYIALQQIADSVSCGYNVKITVQLKDAVLTFERGKVQNEVGFTSFAEIYNKYHNGENK